MRDIRIWERAINPISAAIMLIAIVTLSASEAAVRWPEYLRYVQAGSVVVVTYVGYAGVHLFWKNFQRAVADEIASVTKKEIK